VRRKSNEMILWLIGKACGWSPTVAAKTPSWLKEYSTQDSTAMEWSGSWTSLVTNNKLWRRVRGKVHLHRSYRTLSASKLPNKGFYTMEMPRTKPNSKTPSLCSKSKNESPTKTSPCLAWACLHLRSTKAPRTWSTSTRRTSKSSSSLLNRGATH